jgi:hypothetical protein
MLQNKLLTVFFLLIFLISVNTFAEENEADAPSTGPSEPESTEIILPPMYLEIEDLSVEDINAVIPDEDSVYLSAVDMPLPEPGDISIPSEVFAVSGLDIPDAQSPGEAAENSFFSEGTIGAGTSYNITGDINLYRIGEQPDFRLRYYHNGYDGFAGREPGEGFSYREELIEAEMNYTNDDLSVDIFVEYDEVENGLQGQADYFSMTHRIPVIDAGISWMLLDNLEFISALNASAAVMTLNSSSSLGCNVYMLKPETGLKLGNDNLSIGLNLGYDIEGSFPVAAQAGMSQAVQMLYADLGFIAAPAEEFKLEVEAGVLWKDYSTLLFPFSVSISGTVDGAVDYDLSGGYKAEKLYYKDLWKDNPLSSAPSDTSTLAALPLTYGWFGDGNLSWNIMDNLAIRASAAFSNLTDAVAPWTSVFTGLGSLTDYDCLSLETGAEIFFKVSDGFSLTAGWEGQFLQQVNLFKPLHRIYADIELNSEDRNVGLIAGSELRIYDPSQSWYVNDWLPRLGFEGYMRFSDGLMLSLSAEDLASGLLGSGRKSWNGYLEQGLFLQIKTKISL